MDSRKSISTDLFYKIRSRFTGLKLGESQGAITINPEEAVFFDFDYSVNEQVLGHVSISLAEPGSMKVYFSNGITEDMDVGQKNHWYDFLKELRIFAKKRLLNFDTRDVAKDNLDQRDFKFLSQYNATSTVGESIMSESNLYGSRTVSYQKLMDTKLIIKHSKPVQDEQIGSRARNISALFVENQDGERFKYPFIHLAGARAMQRHVANGGVPYDDIGKHIVSMSEQIAQLKGFGNYVVRNDLLNSDTNSIYTKSSEALNKLREEIAKLSKQAYYEQFKNSFQLQDQLAVPDEVVEDFTEKFTVKNFKEDIKSVFPILYKLMKEESAVGYNDIVEMTGQEEIEIDESDEDFSSDPFAKFENWVHSLGEASAIESDDEEERSLAIQKLNELTKEHFAAGVGGTNAIESLKGIIEDPELDKAIKQAADQDPDTCVRGLVKNWLESNAPDVLDQIDFGDFVEDEEDIEDPMQYANDSADADAEYYGQKEDMTSEANASNGEYELEVETKVYFERDESGKVSVSKIMMGNTDITALVDAEETAQNIDDSEESPADGIEYVMVDIDYDVHGEYRPATWGYHGGDPAEYPEVEITDVTAYGNGKSMPIDINDLSNGNQEYLQDQAEEKAADGGYGADDYDDYDDRRDMYDDAHQQEEQGKKAGMQELAEFIFSFYDRESKTFPKGPEGVCTMVGKKFGEQAEHMARRLVEKLAPQQSSRQDPELAELSRIGELAGVSEGPMWDKVKAFGAKAKDAITNFTDYGAEDMHRRNFEKWIDKQQGLIQHKEELLQYFDDEIKDGTESDQAGRKALDRLKMKARSVNQESNDELARVKKLSGIAQGLGI